MNCIAFPFCWKRSLLQRSDRCFTGLVKLFSTWLLQCDERKLSMSSCCSCLLSSVLHGPIALWVYDLLYTENQLPVPQRSPLNSHSSLFHTVHPLLPSCLFLSLIIPHIYSPCLRACSMTAGLLPWRTNHAFHSGSKREVSLFCVFLLSVHICMLFLVGFVKCSFMLTEKLCSLSVV